MFFILSKILTYLLRPLIWVAVLLALSLFHKKPHFRKRCLWAAFLIVLVFSNTFVVNKITKLWIINPAPVTQKFDVGVVLGGSTATYEEKYQRITYKGQVDRLLQAVAMYRKGKIKKILVTGASGNLIYNRIKEARLMQSLLLDAGIPQRDILVDTLAENTHENAVYTKQLLQQHPKLKTILLFTSSLHMRRALACFHHEGLYPRPYPTNLLNTTVKWNVEYLLIPQTANFLIWNGLIHEIIGYLAYKMMGYI